MSTTVKVNMLPVNTIMTRLGVQDRGAIQKFVTATVNRRITRYMPFRTGWLATKAKFIKSDTEIEVIAPYVRPMYYGKKMVNAKTGNGPALIKGVGYRYRKGTILKETDIPLDYDKTKHPLAGPLWDVRMMAAEGAQIAEEVQAMVDRRAKR